MGKYYKGKLKSIEETKSLHFSLHSNILEISSEESEHSCHVPSHMMLTLSPQIFGNLSAPEVVNYCTVRPCCLF